MLYESTPAMMHSIDQQGRLVHVSDVWLATLGATFPDTRSDLRDASLFVAVPSVRFLDNGSI
jgi:hypothetical protein